MAIHKLAFVPPKPNEFLRKNIGRSILTGLLAVIIFKFSKSLSILGISLDGGRYPWLNAVKAMTVSTAPAAPNK